MNDEKYEQLRKLYYDPTIGLTSANKFFDKIKHLGFSQKQVREFIREQATFQINKEPTKKDYIPILAPRVNAQWQLDLADFTKLKRHNAGMGWILVAVDVYSRKAWAEALKDKTEPSVVNGFKEITLQAIDEDTKIEAKLNEEKQSSLPESITTDKGSEFVNNRMKQLLVTNKIKQYVADPGDKHRTAIAERFIQTLRKLIKRYQTANQTQNWYDGLQELVKNYNNATHSTLDATPNEVYYGFKPPGNLIKDDKVERKTQTFKIGDRVRILNSSTIFTKQSSAQKYSRAIYKIVGIEQNSYKVANITDKDEKPLVKSYRPYQLQLITSVRENNEADEIEKKLSILKKQIDEDDMYQQLAKIRAEGIDEDNILAGKRTKIKNKKYL